MDEDRPINYKFTYSSLQPRHNTAFPFIVSEPTEDLQMEVLHSRAQITDVGHFSAFVTGATQGNPVIDLDTMNKVFRVRSVRKGWLFQEAVQCCIGRA